MRTLVILAAIVSTIAVVPAIAKTVPITAAEKTFVADASQRLQSEYPNTAAAKSKGFVLLYDSMDTDNTYNWTNMNFSDVTPDRPNFIWYDRRGHIAGVDYELLKSRYPSPPHLAAFPVLASRWTPIDEHVHYAYSVNGVTKYGGAHAAPEMRSGKITLEMLRAHGAKIPSNAKIVWAMYHPAVWDLAMWVVPNPRGAFADLNPNVK